MMKKHVSVPGMSRTPWNSLPNTFAKMCIHLLLYLSDLMRCRYSNTAPVSSSMTAPMKCSDVVSAECCSWGWRICAARAYPCRSAAVDVLGGGSCAAVMTCSAMTQLIMCAVRAWRRVCALVVNGAVCAQEEWWRGVRGTKLSSGSSSMMAGRFHRSSGGLVGELALVLHMGCWMSLGLHITTGSSSIVGRGAWTDGGCFAKEESS